MKLEVPAKDREAIEKLIGDENSPVGIDAKKTHVLIIAKLLDLERRLDSLDRRFDEE